MAALVPARRILLLPSIRHTLRFLSTQISPPSPPLQQHQQPQPNQQSNVQNSSTTSSTSSQVSFFLFSFVLLNYIYLQKY